MGKQTDARLDAAHERGYSTGFHDGVFRGVGWSVTLVALVLVIGAIVDTLVKF